MLLALLSRLLRALFVLVGVSVVVFALLKLAPGDTAAALLGPIASEEAKAILRSELGLDRPVWVQYLSWMGSLIRGDFGVSLVSRNPVLDEVLPRFGNSALLALVALLLALAVGLGVGIAAAERKNGPFDRLSMGGVQVVGALPPFWLGLVLVYVFALSLRWLPATGMTKAYGGGDFQDVFLHLILPAVTAAAAPAAVIVRMVRAAFLEVLSQDYVQVALARGAGRRRIRFRHVLPNCLPPILTIVGLQLGYLIGSALFTEIVFAWPGIGQLLYQAILGRDVALVQGCVLFIALAFVLVNLAVDLANEAIAAQRS